ncbi:MAG: hypothetical protein WCO35_03815 [Candidatus Nomurabacteria bacterium]
MGTGEQMYFGSSDDNYEDILDFFGLSSNEYYVSSIRDGHSGGGGDDCCYVTITRKTSICGVVIDSGDDDERTDI